MAFSVSSADGAGISMMSHRLFRKLDHDHNSRVSQDEMMRSGVLRKTGLAKSDEEEKKVFATIDANKDGVVSEAESNIFFSQVMAGSPQAMAAIAMMLAGEPDEEEPLARTAAKADLPAEGDTDRRPDGVSRPALGYDQDLAAPGTRFSTTA